MKANPLKDLNTLAMNAVDFVLDNDFDFKKYKSYAKNFVEIYERKTNAIEDKDIVEFQSNLRNQTYLQAKLFAHEFFSELRDSERLKAEKNYNQLIELIINKILSKTNKPINIELKSTTTVHPNLDKKLWSIRGYDIFKRIYETYYLESSNRNHQDLMIIWYYLDSQCNDLFGRNKDFPTQSNYTKFLIKHYKKDIGKFHKWKNMEASFHKISEILKA